MNNNIKKRRAYCHEDSPAESVLQDVSHPSSAGSDPLSLPGNYQYNPERALSANVRIDVPISTLVGLNQQDLQHYIFQQAALNLGWPLPFLLELSTRQHHIHKRPRLNTSLHMSAPYSGDEPLSHNGLEKSPLTSRPGHNGSVLPPRPPAALTDNGFPSGWTGTRLADCFASFGMCPPCSTYEPSTSYQPLPTTASYDYDAARPAFDGGMLPIQSHGQASFNSSPIASDQTGIFACDEPALFALAGGYPPMQPNRVMGTQPQMSREEMVYPVPPVTVKYDSNVDTPRNGTDLRVPIQSHLMSPSVRPSNSVPGPYNAELDSPPFSRYTSFVGLPPRYHSSQSYEVKGDPDGLELQGRSATFDLFPHQRTLPARRGPFTDRDKRDKTALTRKMGSCIRCRMQRIRCNLDPEDERGPCVSCKKIAVNSKVYRLNCLRWKITDVKLFKPGQVKGLEWTNRWKDSVVDDIENWAAPESRTIYVTEGYTGESVALQVRQFRPQEGDKLDRSWVSGGVKKKVQVPAFAIVDMDAAKSAFDQYIKRGLIQCCRQVLDAQQELLWRTYFLAIGTMRNASTSDTERKLLMSTLDLWMSVRLTTKSFEIVGKETLGMPQDLIDDQDNPLYHKIPLPPVMGAQIDSVLIHQIQPQLRRRTLEELQKMTQDKKQKTWLTTYLVTFILLHNIALITKHDADYAKKHGMGRRFAREQNVKEYNLGANTLLAYFHYCNKGIYPFSDDCKDQDLHSLAELDENAIRFVGETRRLASNQKQQWEDSWRRDEYENEYFYVSQLFEPNWQPRTMT
ncbi:hypothetical protein B0T26DRAFT_737127 [Lasiosphaeria miniovina]|uniref:Zn(2)-C6 fungal-type domain-containing protein n=1 Tax=Lasiosphaeria miniovina TaxID=1954250 RepID=A0AA40EDK5_9PEZI|nr:uncharacterized protein B0T26DRAFT_737127 [Lasiosphaeria miniovina]KAK0734452.1 hypothetical protein B0T26DRAFT_737127 [Lasiosphaeria miniovina]